MKKKEEEKNKRAVIYARFSSSGQREESIEGQERECRAYAMRKGWPVIRVYADRALTGTNDKRPQFQKMIADSALGDFEVVICWKHDRFARNRYDAALYKARLKSNGVMLDYAAETVPPGPDGIILDSVMEGYAEYYSANLSQNVLRGLYENALARKVLSRPPYGLMQGPDGKFAIDPVTGPVVHRVFEEFAAGKPSKQITDELSAEGVRSYTGAPLGKNFVAQMVANPKYKGVYEYADIYDPHGVPAIVDEDLWDRANSVLAYHSRAPGSKQLCEDGYLLSGKLYCGHCQESMTAGSGKSRLGILYQYYACNGRRVKKNGCTMRYVEKKWIEDAVIKCLAEVIFSDEIIEMFADRLVEWQKHKIETTGKKAAEAELADVRKRIQQMVEFVATGQATRSITYEIQRLEHREDELVEALGKMIVNEHAITRDEVIWYLESFRNGDTSDPNWRVHVVNVFLQRAYLFDDGRLLLHLNYAGDRSVISVTAIDAAFSGPDSDEISRLSSSAQPSRDNAKQTPPFAIFFAGALVCAFMLSRQ